MNKITQKRSSIYSNANKQKKIKVETILDRINHSMNKKSQKQKQCAENIQSVEPKQSVEQSAIEQSAKADNKEIIDMTQLATTRENFTLVQQQTVQNQRTVEYPYNLYLPNELGLGPYINYNYLPKINCTITQNEYIDDLCDYFIKMDYYKSVAMRANVIIDNDKLHNIVVKNMRTEKIVNVTTIYIDYPFYTTIKINNKLKTDILQRKANPSNLSIYRELLPKELSSLGQLDTLLKNSTNKYNSNHNRDSDSDSDSTRETSSEYKIEKIIMDFYNVLIFLYKIIFRSNNSFITKRELLSFIKDSNIINSIYTDKFIDTNTIHCIDSLLSVILDNIKVEHLFES